MPDTWQRIATAPGGTVGGLATVGGLVFAATQTGVRISSDGGRRWTIGATEAAVPFASVVLPSPSFEDNQTVFAAGRAGAYRSRDAGQTWTPILVGSAILALAAAPGALFAGSEVDGLLRSDDDGRTWSGANPGLLDLTVLSIALSRDFARDRTAFVGTTSGVYRSRNAGNSWRAADVGVADEVAVSCLAVSSDNVVFAGTESEGMFRSSDLGSTWHDIPALHERTVNAIAPGRGGAITAATDHGVAISHDAGESWTFVTAQGLDRVLSLVYLDDHVLLAGSSDAGILRSEDDGKSWTTLDEGLNARVLVRLAAASRAHLYVADLQGTVRASRDSGATWTEDDLGLDGAPVTDLAIAEGGIVLAGTGAGMRRLSTTWHGVDGLPRGAIRRIAACGRLALAIVEDQGLFVSDDAGLEWRSIDVPFAARQVLSALCTAAGTMYACTRTDSEVLVWRHAPERAGWQRWLVEPATGVDVAPMALRPKQDTLFVGLPGRVLHPIPNATHVSAGERRPMWRSSVLEPAGTVVTDLVVSLEGEVLAATNHGVFASVDGGQQFVPRSEGLPSLPVLSLAWPEPDCVYALLLGGSVYASSPS